MKEINVGYVILAIIVVLTMIDKKPVCWFDTKMETPKAKLSDIQNRINGLSNGTLNLYHTGSSMYPTIIDGQVCACDKQDTYHTKDIVSFYIPNDDSTIEFISHRITMITPLGYITKGDNNPMIDYVSVPPENVFCKIREESYLDKILAKVKRTS